MKAGGQAVPDEGNALAWDPALLIISALSQARRRAPPRAADPAVHPAQTDYQGIAGTYDFASKAQADNRGLTIKEVYAPVEQVGAELGARRLGPSGTALVTPDMSAAGNILIGGLITGAIYALWRSASRRRSA